MTHRCTIQIEASPDVRMVMPKAYSGSRRRVRGSGANLMHNDASTGHPSDAIEVPKRVKRNHGRHVPKPPRPIKVCPCCNEEFVAYRDNQVFKSGHYRRRYVMHKCPDCGVMHLKGIGVK